MQAESTEIASSGPCLRSWIFKSTPLQMLCKAQLIEGMLDLSQRNAFWSFSSHSWSLLCALTKSLSPPQTRCKAQLIERMLELSRGNAELQAALMSGEATNRNMRLDMRGEIKRIAREASEHPEGAGLDLDTLHTVLSKCDGG